MKKQAVHHSNPSGPSLLDAVQDGDLAAVKKFLQQPGVDVNEKDYSGDCLLCIAVNTGKLEIARALLDKGASPDSVDGEGVPVLIDAARSNKTSFVKLLLEKGANVDCKNRDGNTPLMVAISSWGDKEDVIRALLDKGASTTIKNYDGETAMSLAKRDNNTSTLQIIREALAERKRIAAEFAQAAEDKRKAELAEKQQKLRDLAKGKPRPKPGPPKIS